MKWYEDYDIFVKAFEKNGELLDETKFYFNTDVEKKIHYIGCLYNFDNPYWVGYCDVIDGCDFATAQEMFEAKIFSGKSIKDRWKEVVIVGIGGIRADDYVMPDI